MMSSYAAYFSIEKKLKNSGVNVDRTDLVHSFTNGKKDSLRALTPFEFREFIRWLNSTFSKHHDELELKCNNMRRKIISLFIKIGWVENGQADMERIYAWVIKSGLLKKPLKEYSYQELPALVSQVECIYKKFIENVQ
jgi:hypothetical protein